MLTGRMGSDPGEERTPSSSSSSIVDLLGG